MQEQKIFYPNKLKTFFLFLVCLIFVWSSLFLSDSSKSWTSAIFFGLGVIVFGIKLVPNSTYLKLTKEGFEIKSLYKSSFYTWNEVGLFEVTNIQFNKMIVFNFSPNYKKHKKSRKFAAFLSKGFEGALPTTYSKNAYDLAKILNDWKLRHSNS
jgi:hypothetical protein